MAKTHYERKLADVKRRVAILKRQQISKRIGFPFLLRPREVAAILGITVKELPALRNLVPAIRLDPKTPRYRTSHVAGLIQAELERLRRDEREDRAHEKLMKRRAKKK